MNVKRERSEATRTSLLGAGRRLFAERGYSAVGTEEIVAAAGVTRGALYHHFRDKTDLFRTIVEEVEQELIEQVAEAALGNDDPLRGLSAGSAMFLDACREPEIRQILLLDAPSVLGWQEWREIDARYGLGLVKAALGAAIESGAIAPQPVDPLAHLLLGALSEAALMVAESDDPERARRETGESVERLLAGLRAAGG